MLKLINFSFCCFLSFSLYAQAPVLVAESTLKVGLMSEEIFYYGFAEGDQIVFDFEETKGKELKELEITEMPSTSRFLDYKTTKIVNKIINVTRTGIYKFRFSNSAIGIGIRICNYKIQRIPASPATQNFNTAVFTHVVYDTTYTSEMEDYLAFTDTVINNFQDRIIKVNSKSDPNGNKASFNFVLPENVVGWSYYISADPAGIEAYEEANKLLLTGEKSVTEKFPKYNLLAALAFNKPVAVTKLQSGPEISFWVMEAENVNLFNSGAQFRYMKKGKGVNDYARVDPRKGSLFFCFLNDNATDPVNVTVKISVIQVNEALQTREVKRIKATPKNEMYLKN